ncbi:transglycosylase SLT domain-containing protein [Methyloglobulus sp.]|uniref:transglycosylase SLT domain-containing protein n=1 Tax=Methyloglobulus sp. TaxID=2518622 RepID=UPI003989CED8
MRLLQIVLIVFISLSIVVNYCDSAAASTGAKASKNNSHRGHKSHGRSKGKKHTARKTDSSDVWERIRLGLKIQRLAPALTGSGQSFATKYQHLSGSIGITGSIRIHNDGLSRLTTGIAPKKLLRGESRLPQKLRARQALMSKKEVQSNTGLRPADKYTRLRRLKRGPKVPSTSLAYRLSHKAHITPNEKLSLAKGDGYFKSSSVQRIRTRLGLHPELFKRNDVAVAGYIGENSSPDKKKAPGSQIGTQQHAASRNCSDLNKRDVASLAQQSLLPESYSQMEEQCRIKRNGNYERVSRQITGYSQRTGLLYQASERARPYLYHIVDALSKYNLPLDLALLPIVESAYQATALSPKDAAGIWQFIPSTGREYGLQQKGDYDARLDVTASTYAAIRFLSGLKDHFKGDWLLALAAYNCGQGTVDAAIGRNQAEGLDTDFWSLDLPAETQDYVPRLLALSSIFANPGSYGLKLRPVRNEPYFIKVNIDHETDINHLANKDLRTVAKLADFDPDQFNLLNSAYLKSALTGSGPFTLLMPISNANLLHQSLAFMVQLYKDENPALPSFSALSLSSESSWPQIQEPFLAINLNEGHQWPLSVGQSGGFDVKPKSTGNDIATAKSTDDDYWIVHYFDKGESLKAVAEYHGISEWMLRVANKFKRRQNISLGQRLLIPLKKQLPRL